MVSWLRYNMVVCYNSGEGSIKQFSNIIEGGCEG